VAAGRAIANFIDFTDAFHLDRDNFVEANVKTLIQKIGLKK